MHKELLEDIGEKELIKRLAEFMPKNQVSDDCALIKAKNKNLLINTDSLVENIHFNDDTISALDIGWKAVACNVSDLISSGCSKIIGVNIGLVVPSNTDWIWIKDLYTGINLALDHFGGLILGGEDRQKSRFSIFIENSPEISLLDLDLESFSFHFHFSKNSESKIFSLCTSRKREKPKTFHFSDKSESI